MRQLFIVFVFRALPHQCNAYSYALQIVCDVVPFPSCIFKCHKYYINHHPYHIVSVIVVCECVYVCVCRIAPQIKRRTNKHTKNKIIACHIMGGVDLIASI